jgi:hypothetical protein
MHNVTVHCKRETKKHEKANPGNVDEAMTAKLLPVDPSARKSNGSVSSFFYFLWTSSSKNRSPQPSSNE